MPLMKAGYGGWWNTDEHGRAWTHKDPGTRGSPRSVPSFVLVRVRPCSRSYPFFRANTFLMYPAASGVLQPVSP